MRLGRSACVPEAGVIAVLAFVAGCTERPPTPPVLDPLAGLVIVSAPTAGFLPVARVTAAGTPVASARGAAAPAVAYVSLPPNSVPAGTAGQISNHNTGETVDIAIVSGGFDPTPIAANVDDELIVNVHTGSASPLTATIKVPRRRPPTVLRADPPNGKTDVQLNTQILVVFNEPIDAKTILGAVQLFHGSEAVAGAATLESSGLVAVFVPNTPLAPNTTYTLVITTAVSDLNGDALERAARFDFKTGPGPQSTPPSQTVQCQPATPSFAPGLFAPTGNMMLPRLGAATLLPDGRVVVYDGTQDLTARPQAEVFDHATQTFTAADDMITIVDGHVAVTLPQGKLLFFGGTVLQDGRVFFASSPSAEIYDPASGTFTPTAPYAHSDSPTWTTRTLLLDGRVLLAGYERPPSGVLPGATELFDPKTGTFKRTGAMQAYSDTPGWGTLLADGRVLFVQWNFNFPPDAIELYDPSTETFAQVGCIDTDYPFSAAVRLQDGTVLITGGQVPGGNGSDGTLLFLPAQNKFVAGLPMTIGRHLHTATLLPDGRVLITGGYSIWPARTLSAEIYTPPTPR